MGGERDSTLSRLKREKTNDDDGKQTPSLLFPSTPHLLLSHLTSKMVSVDQQSTLRSRSNGDPKVSSINTSTPSTRSISSIDDETHELEFGGAPGTLAMMVGFPILFYYLYVCIFFNHGTNTPCLPLSL